MLSNWQRRVSDCGLDIIEVIAVRGAGKTYLGLEWVSTDADTSIVITIPEMNPLMKAQVAEFSQTKRNASIHVISNLEQLRKINTHSKKRVRVYVDEYLRQRHVTLKQLDNYIGNEAYKVMFSGSKVHEDDKFIIPISKQFSVGIDHLLNDRLVSPEQILKVIDANGGQFGSMFTSPFEIN